MTTPELPVREIAAAVVLLGKRVLVQTRPEGRSYGGSWEFPGGKIEPGEEAAACVLRECREELGLAVTVLGPLHVESWSYPGAAVRVTFLLCAPADPQGAVAAAQPREGQRVLWADAEDLARLTFLPANAAVLELLAQRFASGDGPPR